MDSVEQWALKRSRLAGLLLVVVAWAFLGAGSSGAIPRSPGVAQGSVAASRIYWSQFVDSDFSGSRIVVGDPAGRHVRILTHPAAGVHDIDPQVSPDGSLVLFERDYADGSADVAVVGANGRGERVINLRCVDPCAADVEPTWTPDGRHVVFTRVVGPFDRVNDSAASAVLWRTDLQGKHLARLSQRGIDGKYEDYRATFAPDGYIVFIRVRNADVNPAAFRMDADGSDVRRLTPWRLQADTLSVSPARKGPTRNLVVFETYGHSTPSGTASAVATVSANSRCGKGCATHIRYLTSPHSLPVQNFNPAWSPDGRQIAYVRFSSVESDDPPVRGDIWRMRWDGAHKRRVSHSLLFEFRPAWGRSPHSSLRR